MTVEEAYRQLGLRPLDDFIMEAVRQNVAKTVYLQRERYKGIGATTWMCVTAALKWLEGQPVQFLGDPQHETSCLTSLTCGLIHRLSGQTMEEIHQAEPFPFLLSIPPPVLHFHDRAWKERAIRRALEPFAMIREVRLENGHCNAYAEDDEFLLELTPEGAASFLLTQPGDMFDKWT